MLRRSCVCFGMRQTNQVLVTDTNTAEFGPKYLSCKYLVILMGNSWKYTHPVYALCSLYTPWSHVIVNRHFLILLFEKRDIIITSNTVM